MHDVNKKFTIDCNENIILQELYTKTDYILNILDYITKNYRIYGMGKIEI